MKKIPPFEPRQFLNRVASVRLVPADLSKNGENFSPAVPDLTDIRKSLSANDFSLKSLIESGSQNLLREVSPVSLSRIENMNMVNDVVSSINFEDNGNI